MSGGPWRSTTLQLAADHCGAVLDFLDKGQPYDRSIFHVGTAAHAVLEDLGKATVAAGRWLSLEEAEPIARATCERLITEGRDFEGETEPPLPSSAVWQGRDLALRYQADSPLSPKYRYEETLAVTREFLPCPAEGEPWLKARIDAHGTSLPAEEWWEDDDTAAAGPVLEVLDYKSAWTADVKALYTIQRKIQAVVAWAHWGEGHDALRLVVVNFRTARTFETVLFPRTPEGAAVMERWRQDIASEIKAREGVRVASPGACCLGCPFLAPCSAAQAMLGAVYGAAEPEELAAAYAVNLAAAKAVEPALREATAEQPIEVPGGFVGTEAAEERKLAAGAHERLAAFWLAQAKPTSLEQLKAMLPGLLAGMKIGTGQVDALLKQYLKREAEQIRKREALLAEMTHVRVRPLWGAHKSPPPEMDLMAVLRASLKERE